MKVIENLIYGFISGLAEFLPISSVAHQKLLNAVFGSETVNPVRNLFVHVAIFAALYFATVQMRGKLDRAKQQLSRRRTTKKTATSAVMEYLFLRRASIPFLVVFFLLCYIVPASFNLFFIALFLLINGVVIYLPERMLRGNKNAKVMSKFESILIGFSGGLSAIPGLSRVGLTMSVSAMCGADQRSSANWALLLSLPAVFARILVDLLAVFATTGIPFWSNLLYYLLSAIFAFLGTRAGIYILRRHIRNNGCTGYAFYCWGAALFALILFLTVA